MSLSKVDQKQSVWPSFAQRTHFTDLHYLTILRVIRSVFCTDLSFVQDSVRKVGFCQVVCQPYSEVLQGSESGLWVRNCPKSDCLWKCQHWEHRHRTQHNPRTQETEAGRPRVQLCGESEASPGSLRLCLKTKQKTSQPTKRFMSKLLRIFRVVFVCTLVYASKTIQNGPKRLFDEFTAQYRNCT